MTYSAPARQRKPTLWDSKVAVCPRLGLLSCAERLGQLPPDAPLASQLSPATLIAVGHRGLPRGLAVRAEGNRIRRIPIGIPFDDPGDRAADVAHYCHRPFLITRGERRAIVERSTTGMNPVDPVETGWTEQHGRGE
jgi:hypothetical protein